MREAHMRSGQSVSERLAQLNPIERDGEIWWTIRDVCDALRIQTGQASKAIPPELRRRILEYRPGYNSRIIGITCMKGVEQLVIRYSQEPRYVVMEALRKSRERIRDGIDECR